MEAFCNICKKEVCNKYFLKSHLLKKHGLKLVDYLAAQKRPTSGVRSSRTFSDTPHSSLLYQNDNLEQNDEDSTFNEEEYIDDYVEEPNEPEDHSIENQYTYHQQSTSPHSEMNEDEEMANDLSYMNEIRTSLTNKETCDVCLKQFCNKFYVKKHKKEVHGLDVDEKAMKTNSKKKINELLDPISTQNGLKFYLNSI
jgi:hypothetical protein